MDTNVINTLRNDAEIHALDFSRAAITRLGGGDFRVTFDKPRFDCRPFLESAGVGDIVCRTAGQAEVELLRGLIRLERGERQKVRVGRVVGWSSADICHRPLSNDEIAEHCARCGHVAEVERLREQLSEALARKARREAATQAAAQITDRYGLRNESALPSAAQGSAVSAHPAKRPVGRPRKQAIEQGVNDGH